MPPATTPTATSPGPIKMKTVSVQPAAAAVPRPEPPTAVPPEPLDMALSRLSSTVQADISGSLVVYRSHVESLSRDVRLSGAEMDALAHSLRVLNLTAGDVKDDVGAIRSRCDQIRHAASASAIYRELESQQSGWLVEEDAIKKRIVEISQLRRRTASAAMMAAQHNSEANRILHNHVRVFGTLEAATAAALVPKGQPYQMRTIRSSGDAQPTVPVAATPVSPVVPMEVPAELFARG